MNRNSVRALLLAGVAFTGACQKDGAKAGCDRPGGALSEDEKTVYALGAMMGQRFAGPMHLSERELDLLVRGLRATGRGGKPEFAIEGYAQKFDVLARSRAAAGAADNKKAADAFRDEAAQETGALRYPSGLIYKTLKPGNRCEPEADRRRARPLPRHAARREGVRQLGAARPAGRVRRQPGDPVLDRGRPAHEGGREGEARLPVRDRLRRQRHARRNHPARRHAGVRGGAARHQGAD